MKKKSNYNQSIRDKVDQVEFTYDSADWNALSKKLPTKGFPMLGKVSIAVVATALISFVAYYGTQSENKELIGQKPSSKKQTEQQSQLVIKETNNETFAEEITPTKETKAQPENAIEKANPETSSSQVVKEISDKNIKSVEIEPKKKQSISNELIVPKLQIAESVVCFGERMEIKTDYPLSAEQTILINGIPAEKEVLANKIGGNKIQLLDNNVIIDEQQILVIELPDASFDFFKKEEQFAQINYTFEAKTSTASYKWFINGEPDGTDRRLTKTYKRKGSSSVKLEVINIEGCRSFIERDITIEESFDLLSYDAFTPNGDGLNDEFIPKAIAANDLRFTMTIYTPSGIELYTTNDYYQPWNGRRNNNGEMMPTGVYLWKVLVYDDEQQAHPYKGQIKIVNLE